MVVAHDVEYVGALVVLRGGLQCQKQQRAGEGMVRHGLLVYEFLVYEFLVYEFLVYEFLVYEFLVFLI